MQLCPHAAAEGAMYVYAGMRPKAHMLAYTYGTATKAEQLLPPAPMYTAHNFFVLTIICIKYDNWINFASKVFPLYDAVRLLQQTPALLFCTQIFRRSLWQYFSHAY
jgi:hypothetical protein